MQGKLKWVLAAGFLSMVCFSCEGQPAEKTAPPESRRSEAPTPANLPLKEIMRGLESDLAELSHGIWMEDHGAAGAAAGRIASHPKVTPEEMAAIQASLQDEFPSFVQMDLKVHDAAVAFADAAEASEDWAELFAGSLQIQHGCFSCHETYRTRVSQALESVREP